MHPVVQTRLVATSVTARQASQEDIVKLVSFCFIDYREERCDVTLP